jgi:hypothetical protein
MKSIILTSLCTLALVACNAGNTPPDATEQPETDPAPPEEAGGSAPEIGTMTFDELDIAGCGMSLWAPGTDPRADGIYLFNSVELPDGAADGTMRMKLNSDVVKFQRTAGEGEEYYGQFNSQTFESLEGDWSADVTTEVTSEGPDPEVMGVEGTITVTGNGQEVTVEAVGDAGC